MSCYDVLGFVAEEAGVGQVDWGVKDTDWPFRDDRWGREAERHGSHTISCGCLMIPSSSCLWVSVLMGSLFSSLSPHLTETEQFYAHSQPPILLTCTWLPDLPFPPWCCSWVPGTWSSRCHLAKHIVFSSNQLRPLSPPFAQSISTFRSRSSPEPERYPGFESSQMDKPTCFQVLLILLHKDFP